MKNLENYCLKELSYSESMVLDGGFLIGPPPQWVYDLCVEIGTAADAFVAGFKAGSREI